MKTGSAVLVTLAVAIATVLVRQPMLAAAAQGDTISITENSSTSLSVIYNGTDITATGVMNTSADHWTVTIPDSLFFQVFMLAPGVGWKEPDFASPFFGENFVSVSTVQATNQFFVASDQPGLAIIPGVLANGSSLDVGADGMFQGGVPIIMTFTDNGDGPAAVPDSGSSLILLFLSLIALVGANRLRSPRLA
jgi:hypothetical protein